MKTQHFHLNITQQMKISLKKKVHGLQVKYLKQIQTEFSQQF